MKRTRGRPPSGNGASSFHLWWEPEAPPEVEEVSVGLTIPSLPAHDRLVFWALQVEFMDGPRRMGGAHVGLQWNRRHPQSTAVNWGGYDVAGTILRGSPSSLHSTPDDPNTRDFPWSPGLVHTLTVGRGAEQGSWGAWVTDGSGTPHHVRDLHPGGTTLARPVVWSEVFAHCDDPSVTAVWTNPVCRTSAGVWSPTAYRVNYQSERDGGCSNTDVRSVRGGVAQVTSVERVCPQGSLVPIGGQGAPASDR